MNFVAGKPYEGYVWVRAEKPATLFASLESRDGSRSYAEATLAVAAGDWQRVDFTLTPNAGDKAGRFVLALKQPGSIVLGHAFLQPGEWGRFKGLPVRRDVAEGLIDQGITVLRYGGSMVNNARISVEEDDRPARSPSALLRDLVSVFVERLGHSRLHEFLRGRGL